MRAKILVICGLVSLATLCSSRPRDAAGTSAIDVTHYRIDLRFDWSRKSATGEAHISLTFTHPAQSFRLAANDLNIRTVLDGSRENLTFRNDTGSIEIFLPRAFRAGESLEITLAYETRHHNDPDPNFLGGSFGRGLRFAEPTATTPVRRRQMWSHSELDNASSWFPCSNDLADLSTSEFVGTVENGFTVVSNGTLVALRENADGTRIFHYATEYEHPSYLTAVVVGEYIDLLQQYRGIPLHTFCYPDEREAAAATTVRLPDMMRFLTEKTGVAYPFKQYAQVVVQDYPFPGVTGQHTFSIVSDNMIDDHGTHEDFQYLWDGVAFNALAGQWFGNMIIPRRVEDLWLSKSFAQYFEGLYTAEVHGIDEYLLWYHPWETTNWMGDWASGNRHPIVTSQIPDRESFAADSYAKYRGALVLRMLSDELGHELFLEVVQYFIKRFAFLPVTTGDLEEAVRVVSGRDMHWFFDQWVYRTGHPLFQVTDRYDAGTKKYHLTIRQTQQADSASAYPHTRWFRSRMVVEIDTTTEIIRIEPREENRFVFHAPRRPRLVHLDAGNMLIKEIQFDRSREDLMNQMMRSRDASSRNAAMTALTAIARSDSVSPSDREGIIHALRTVIHGEAYWRLRVNALVQLRSLQPSPDTATAALLVSLIRRESSWIKAAALTGLGMSNDTAYASLYLSCLSDSSDRVVNAAAVALGKTKIPGAFPSLVALKHRPSWKNQSLMHALAGLAQLGDTGAVPIALDALRDNSSPRWFLGNGWDYPFVAAQTLNALGRTEAANALVEQRFREALAGGNLDDIFHQVLLIATLGDPRGQEVFDLLKQRYSSDDANIMKAVRALEESYHAALPHR